MKNKIVIARLVSFAALVWTSVLAMPGLAETAPGNALPNAMPPCLQNPAADGMTICFLAQQAESVRVASAVDGHPGLREMAASGTPIPGTLWNPRQVLIGGGPALDEGTVILLNADAKTLPARMLAARDGRLLTEFSSERGQPPRFLEPGGNWVFGGTRANERSYVRTERMDFARQNFQAEVTVTLKGGGGEGCAFFGLGRGEANPAAYMEPSVAPAVFSRLAPGDFAGGAAIVSVAGRESRSSGPVVGDGTHRLRLLWDAAGKRGRFEIDAHWDGHVFRASSAAMVNAAKIDFGKEGRLFVGGAQGVRFTDFAVQELTPAAIQAAGFSEVFDADPTAGTWLASASGARFIQALRAGKKVTIVTMGTSLTGGAWRWPDVMMNDWLNRDWPGQVTLFNEGVGASASSVGFNGDVTTSGLGKLGAVMAHRPDVVIIEFATNDAFLPYKISLADSRKNLHAIIDAILAANPKTEIILQTMNSCLDHPGGGKHASDRPQIAEYFEGYRQVARQRGLLLVDHYPNWLKIMTNDPALFDQLVPDRIHPQAEGYRRVLLPALKAALGPAPAPAAGPAPSAAARFLEPLGGVLRLLACWYDGSSLAASRSFLANGELRTPGSRWTSEVRATPVVGEPDALDLAVTFQLAEGAAAAAGVAVAFEFAGWSTNNYVLIPASVYNGNRNRIERRPYAAGLDRRDLYQRDLPLTTGELPQLSPEPGAPSKIEVNTSYTTTPALCFYDRQTHRAFILLAEQGSRFGDHGLMIEESSDRTRAAFVVSAPGVRERKPEFIGFSASPDRGADWKAGDQVVLRLRAYQFETPDLPGFLDKFMTVRKAVTGPNHPRNLIPFSEITRLMTGRIDSRYHRGREYQFYCPENAEWISFGWVGGLMNTFPMLALADPQHLDRVSRTFDFAIPRAQGRAGYFYGALNHDGKVFGREGYDEYPEIVLTRKNADVLYWMIKQFLLLKAQGRSSAIKPEWEHHVKRLADAFLDTWKKCGQWGNFLNVDTGEVAVYNSTSAAQAMGALVLAASYYQNPAYLTVAQESAGYYYQRDFIQLGLTTGHSADTLQNADGDSPAAFMSSLLALYEATGDPRWLEKSRQLGSLFATWVVSHDYHLPADTELARLGAKLAGVVWASTQNKHGAPGLCTSSCDPLLKIYRATGDRRYAELLHDIVHAHAEGIKPGGEITERLTFCDADSRGSRGGGSTGWCELNGILMAMELPGIYVRTDQDRMFVFDHVEAEVVQRDPAGVTLKISNPTRYDAQVSILAENESQARRPLGVAGFLAWPKYGIKPGAAIQITINEKPETRNQQP